MTTHFIHKFLNDIGLFKKVMKKIIKEIINELDKITSFSSEKINGISIDENNFKQITDKNTNKKICFVDGGNQEIIGGSNFSLQFVRIYYNIFLEKKIDSKKYEFFILINSINEDGIKYKTRIFGDFKELELIFDSFDNTLTGIKRAKISDIGSVIRRFAELKAASLVDIKESIVVLDGDLDIKLTYEDIFMKELFNKIKENSNILLGLSKTTDLFTDNANSIAAVLNNTDGNWYYNISENIYFIKFNNSKYVFRLDFFNFDEDVFSLLLNNSKDPVFIGYPYGLIDADRFARVTNKEKEYLKLKILSQSKNIKPYLNTINAHNILDSI